MNSSNENVLFIVEDVFELSGSARRLILVPGIPKDSFTKVHIGDKIQLKQSNGTTIDTEINGIEMADPYIAERPTPISLPHDVGKENIPVGTRVIHCEKSS